MRPVVKWAVGYTYNTYTIVATYNPYSSAKLYLEANLGRYCSYCERVIEDEAMHVEHIQPKGLSQYTNLEFSWSNFLVSCHRCNGSDNKHNKDVLFTNIHIPHLNNTFISIIYYPDGSVAPNPILNGTIEFDRANALIGLIGLDKMKGHPEHLEGDKRAERRKTVWDMATRYKDNYEKTGTNLTPQIIVDYALSAGFWSVWMKIFENHIDVQNLLISEFLGTYSDCRTHDVNRTLIVVV